MSKEKKISDMSLQEIFSICGFIFNKVDIYYFCNDDEIINEYLEICELNDLKRLKQFLLDHEEELEKADNENYQDYQNTGNRIVNWKERLLFCLYLNYVDNLQSIENRIEQLRSVLLNVNSYELITGYQKEQNELEALLQQKEIQTNLKEKTAKLGKRLDIDAYFLLTRGQDMETPPEIISSIETFQSRRFSEKKNKKVWQQMDEEIGNDGNGSIYIIQTMLLADLGEIMPTPEIGQAIRDYILKKCALDRGVTKKELADKASADYQEYLDFLDNTPPEEYLPLFREELIRNIRFIDIDKIFLIIGYRIEESLEKEIYPKEATEQAQLIIEYILRKIDNKEKVFEGILQEQKTYEKILVNFSSKDLERCSKRFIADKYIKKSEVLQAKTDLLSGSKTLENLETPLFNLIEMTEEETEQIIPYSAENFVYGIRKLGYVESKIIEKLCENPEIISIELLDYIYDTGEITINTLIQLYNRKVISAEFFKEFSEQIDIYSEVNLQKINERYIQIKQSEQQNEEETNNLDTIIEFYKIINLDGKTQEELEEESNNVMYELAEDFEGEEDILFYYEKGLVTLETVAEWSGETIIERLYNEEKITFEDLKTLYEKGKISQSLLQSKIEIENLSYSELMEHIHSGHLNQDKVIELYMIGRIFDIDFEEIARKGLISVQKYYEATSKRTKEELEKNAKIKLKPVLSNIPDKKLRVNVIDDEEYDDDPKHHYTPRNSPKTLIDPNIRYEFLKLLGAKEAAAIIPDENNAFYNYEFFVIPDSNGELQANSVVIAERFFEDKTLQDVFATNNATYFFQYKDLMVNSNLTKKEMMQDRDNVVFTANHRAGSWAVQVLRKVAETLAGESFSKYKNLDARAERILDELHKIYTSEKIERILDLTRRIDDTGEYIYEEVNSSFGKKSHEDDDEEVSL